MKILKMIKEKLKNFFKSERAKMREMSFVEKRWYIWEYYKLHLVAVIFVIGLIGYFINHVFINPPQRDYLYIAWVGPLVYQGSLNEIGENLGVIVNDPYRERVLVTSYAFTDNPQMDSALQQRFFAMIQTGAIDLFLTPQQGAQELAEGELSRPMHEVMEYVAAISPALYQQISNRLLTITFEIEGHTHTDVMAVSLANTPFFEYLGLNANELYLAVVMNTQNFDRIAKALEAIFQWNPVE